MLLEEWSKFKGWTILEFFLANDAKIHLKGLARKLKVSPRTAQIYLKLYKHEGILQSESIGNMILYSISDTFITREFKKAYFLMSVKKHISTFLNDNKGLTSLVLYGSHAGGRYDNKSDIDFLAISQRKPLDLKALKEMESKSGKEVRIEVYSVGEWRKMEKSDFYISVLKNNVLLYGAEI
ncbi:MAG: nucleotidyltransferase domain-containing protein [Candidatus Micrarchaeales archaeon]